MPTQVEQLIKHFSQVDSISPMEAHTVYKIRSLPRRIMDMKVLGYQFKSAWNTDLTGQRYKRYTVTYIPGGDSE